MITSIFTHLKPCTMVQFTKLLGIVTKHSVPSKTNTRFVRFVEIHCTTFGSMITLFWQESEQF